MAEAQRRLRVVAGISALQPWQCFRWLVTYNGHWSFVRRVPEIGNLSGKAIQFDGREFKL